MYFVDTLISLSIALVMFLIGTSLDTNKLKTIFAHPKSVIIGLVLQLVMLPLLAFTICAILDIPIAYKWGIVILSLCPGGATSNYISYLFKLNTELSVSLTIINSIIILISIPTGLLVLDFLWPLSVGALSLPIKNIIQDVLLNIFLPVVLGLFCQNLFKSRILAAEKPIKYATILLVIVSYSIKLFADSDNGGTGITLAEVYYLLPIVLALHLATMIGSYLISRGAMNCLKTSKTISIEVGLQNTSLALLVASMLINSSEISKPAMVFTLFSTFTTITFILLVNLKSAISIFEIAKSTLHLTRTKASLRKNAMTFILIASTSVLLLSST